MALGGNATFASQLLNSSAAQIWKWAALRACAPLGPTPHFRHVNISFSCSVDAIYPCSSGRRARLTAVRLTGRRQHKGTDALWWWRQEWGAASSTAPPRLAGGLHARSEQTRRASRWTRCKTRVWMWPWPTPRIVIVHRLHAFSRHSKHSPKQKRSRSRCSLSRARNSSKVKHSEGNPTAQITMTQTTWMQGSISVFILVGSIADCKPATCEYN